MLLIALVSVVVIGCGPSISVTHDYDKEADFTKLKTFSWMAVGAIPVGNAKTAVEQNTLLDKRIKSAVNRELETKGYEMNEANPDFVMIYHVGVDDKINVTDWGYGYPSPYWGGRNVSVYQYTQGTLILDIIEPATKQLIWRGEAQGTVDQDASPEDREAKLNLAAAKLLDNFPPMK
jgi:hypothetical protein